MNSLPADALAKAKVQLMTAIEGMSVGDSVSVTIDFGSFQSILQIEVEANTKPVDHFGHNG